MALIKRIVRSYGVPLSEVLVWWGRFHDPSSGRFLTGRELVGAARVNKVLQSGNLVAETEKAGRRCPIRRPTLDSA